MIPIDYKIDKIIKEIQKEIKAEFKIDVSYETIEAIISQQVTSTVKGIEQGATVVWKYFGTFVATQARVNKLNKSYETRGKTPTLVDSGFYRMSFTRKGEEVAETKFESTSKKDTL